MVASTKDLSATATSWWGGAILALLELAQELWIVPAEWCGARGGQRMLRERARFPWT